MAKHNGVKAVKGVQQREVKKESKKTPIVASAVPIARPAGKAAAKADNNNNSARRAEKTQWKNFSNKGLKDLSEGELKAYQKMSLALKKDVRESWAKDPKNWDKSHIHKSREFTREQSQNDMTTFKTRAGVIKALGKADGRKWCDSMLADSTVDDNGIRWYPFQETVISNVNRRTDAKQFKMSGAPSGVPMLTNGPTVEKKKDGGREEEDDQDELSDEGGQEEGEEEEDDEDDDEDNSEDDDEDTESEKGMKDGKASKKGDKTDGEAEKKGSDQTEKLMKAVLKAVEDNVGGVSLVPKKARAKLMTELNHIFQRIHPKFKR